MSELTTPATSIENMLSKFGGVFSAIASASQQQQSDIKEQSVQIRDISELAKTCVSSINALSEHGKQIASDVSTLKRSVDEANLAFKAQNEDLLKRMAVLERDGPASSPDDTRVRKFAVNYLIRVGMNTRYGFMCAVPVEWNNALYLAISLNLVATTVRTFAPNHAEGKTMMTMRAAFNSVAGGKREIIDLAQKVLPIEEKPQVTAAEARRWVVLRADDFVQMCFDDMTDEEWEVSAKLESTRALPLGDKGFKFHKQTKSVTADANPRPATKLSWGVEACDDILSSQAMVRYRDLVIDKFSPGRHSTTTAHFTANEVFGQVQAAGGPSRQSPPRAAKTVVEQPRGKGAIYMHSPVAPSPATSESDSESSDDSSSDDEAESSNKRKSSEEAMFEYGEAIKKYGANSAVVKSMTKRLKSHV
jgi:hypothetical protein